MTVFWLVKKNNNIYINTLEICAIKENFLKQVCQNLQQIPNIKTNYIRSSICHFQCVVQSIIWFFSVVLFAVCLISQYFGAPILLPAASYINLQLFCGQTFSRELIIEANMIAASCFFYYMHGLFFCWTMHEV